MLGTHEKSPQLRGLRGAFVLFGAGSGRTWDHSHSNINKTPKPAWLKGLAEIDMEPQSLLPSEARIFCWRGRWSDLRGDDPSDTIINRYKR
jgi:hypothetical protein